MRLIDADAVPIIGISDYNVMLQKTLDAQPTVDLWKYPSKGEYPTESGRYFCIHKYNQNLIPTVGIYNAHHKMWCGESGIAWNIDPVAWQQIMLPKEKV